MKTLPDQLRDAIIRSGESVYSVAKRSGVDTSVLGRFVRGERGIGLGTAAKVCTYMGLALTGAKLKRPKQVRRKPR